MPIHAVGNAAAGAAGAVVAPAVPLVTIALIVVVAQLLGEVAERVRQPRVVGEIVGGILLGPSLLGAVAPALAGQLFAPSVRNQLILLGQLGLVLFMFLVGLEVNLSVLPERLRLAGGITAAGVLLPLLFGVGLAHLLQGWQPELLPGANRLAGALFMGTAMAITAFPVLARILRERDLLGRPVGSLAITAASIDDVIGWVLLAGVVAFSRSGSPGDTLAPLLGTAAWAVLLLGGLRPLLARLEHRYHPGHRLEPMLQACLFSGALLSAAVTETLGVHMIFGAFLWGLAMPRLDPLRRRLEQRLEAVVMQLLLPLFFAVSGLNTRIGSLDSPPLWAAAVLVLLVAVAGKFLGVWTVALRNGLPRREAQALGWLLNTRGLTELVILNVGLSLGVISGELFTMGVLMALTTTVMTGPLLGRLGYGPRPRGGQGPDPL